MTAITTLEVRVDTKQAVLSLADIKAAAKDAQDSLASMARAASTPFDRLTKTMEALVSPLEKLVRQMDAMRAGMRSGADAAMRQATATDRLAQSVKSAEAAKQRAISAQRQEIANQRQWEAALTRETGLRERLRRQLAGDQHASARDELGNQLTTAMATYESALKKFGSGSLEGVKARGTLSREFALVSSRIAEINGLLPTLDRGFEKTAKGWASMSKTDKLQLQSNAINFTQQTIASGGPAQALMVQGPELLGLMARYPAVLAPVAAGFVAIGSAVGVAVAGFSRLADESQRLRDFEAGIRGSGQAGILAADDLAKLSDRLNELPNVGREAADKLVASLSRVRGLGAGMTERVALAAPDYAKAIGEQDVGKAGVDLANKLRDPAKAAREFADSMGLLSASQVHAIERMVASGDRAKAMGIIMGAVEKQTRGLAEQMSPLASMVDALGNTWDRLIDRLSKSNVITETAKALEYLANAASAAMGDDRAKAKNLQSEIDKLLTWRQFAATDFAKRNIDSQIADIEKELKPLVMAQMSAEKALKAASEGGGAGIGAVGPAVPDARAEVLDTIEASKALRGYIGVRESLLDQQARIQKAMALSDDPMERRLLSQSLAGLQDQLRQAVDPRAKLITDAQRSASQEWKIAGAPWQDRERLRAAYDSENTAREQGLSGMQREALARANLSSLAAKLLVSIQDSTRSKLEEADAAMRLADVDGMGIVAQQQAADAIARETFARQSLAKASNDNMSAVLAEIDTYGRLVTKLGEVSVASQFRQRARAASPTIQYMESMRDASGTARYMESMGATGDEVRRYYEDIELSKLNASRQWLDGVKRANLEYQRSAMDAASSAADAFKRGAANMNDSLTEFVTGGKVSFTDLSNSVIKDMVRIQMQQSVTAPFMGWVGGGLSSLFSAATGASNPVGTSATTVWTSPTPVTVEPLAPLARASGGLISGPGTGTSDSILARVSNGEFVVRASAVDRHLGLLNAINDNRLPAFADGGYVGGMAPLARGPEAAPMVAAVGGGGGLAPITIENHTTVNVEGGSSGNAEMDAALAQRVAKAVNQQVEAKVISVLHKQMKGGGLMNRV